MTVNQKLEKESFEQIVTGEKRDLRLAAGDVQQGDTLILEEWDADTQEYTGRKIEAVVTATGKTIAVADPPSGESERQEVHRIEFEPKESKYTLSA